MKAVKDKFDHPLFKEYGSSFFYEHGIAKGSVTVSGSKKFYWAFLVTSIGSLKIDLWKLIFDWVLTRIKEHEEKDLKDA